MPASDKPLPPAVMCGRRHQHSSRQQAVECDQRHARRDALKREKTKLEEMMHEGKA
jgi:hypothetical protein